MSTRSLTEGNIARSLIQFALPTLLGSFFQYLYNTADAIILERYEGPVGLAAAGGATGVIINLLLGLFIGISAGSTIVIAQYVGAGNGSKIHRSVHTTAALTLIIGAILTVLGLCFLPGLLRMLGTPENVFQAAVQYLRIYFAGISGMAIYNFGSGILHSLGEAKKPFYALIFCSLLNIAMDILFVGVFGWGIKGAAFATVLSQCISAAYIVYVLIHMKEPYRLYLRKIRLYADELPQMLRIGLPCGVQSMVFAVSNLVMQIFVNHFGTNTIAAVSAYERIESLYILLIEAVSVAVMTFCGQNFGAKQYARMKKGVSCGVLLSLGITLLFSIILLLFTESIAGIFVKDSSVAMITIRILRCIAPFYFTLILVSLLPAASRSAGDSFWPIFISCAGICGVRILSAFLVLRIWDDILAVTLSYPISWLITSCVFALYFFKGNWLPRCIERQSDVKQ